MRTVALTSFARWDCADSTVYNQRYHLNSFLEWCERNDVDNLNELSGRDVQIYRLWRKETSDINKVTMRAHMSTLRVFLKWAASIEAVDESLYENILVPRVRSDEMQRDEKLDPDRAEKILEYLSKFEYASKEHVLIALLWETGIRISSTNSLDVEDVDFEKGRLRLAHRPEEGTRLKNGQGGERLIAISSDLAKMLGDYIDEKRIPNEDEHE